MFNQSTNNTDNNFEQQVIAALALTNPEINPNNIHAALNQDINDLPAPDPWSVEEMTDTFAQIEELIETGAAELNQITIEQVQNIITLANQIHNPEIIDAHLLGYYTTRLMALLDTQNPDIDEMNEVLNQLTSSFNQVVEVESAETTITNPLIMVAIDIHNKSESIFQNLFESKEFSNFIEKDQDLDLVGKFNFSNFGFHDIIITE